MTDHDKTTRIEPGETKRIITNVQPVTGETMATVEITNRGDGSMTVGGEEYTEDATDDRD